MPLRPDLARLDLPAREMRAKDGAAGLTRSIDVGESRGVFTAEHRQLHADAHIVPSAAGQTEREDAFEIVLFGALDQQGTIEAVNGEYRAPNRMLATTRASTARLGDSGPMNQVTRGGPVPSRCRRAAGARRHPVTHCGTGHRARSRRAVCRASVARRAPRTAGCAYPAATRRRESPT